MIRSFAFRKRARTKTGTFWSFRNLCPHSPASPTFRYRADSWVHSQTVAMPTMSSVTLPITRLTLFSTLAGLSQSISSLAYSARSY